MPAVHAHRRLAAAVEAVEGAAQIGATVLGAPLLRRSYNRWGATEEEQRSAMPGDALVPAPRIQYTRAITIDAPAEAVWPWLDQIGHGRGGLYSFDALENLIGCDLHSADHLLPVRPLAVGDPVRLGPERRGFPCFRVMEVRPPWALVLLGADPTTLETPALPVVDEDQTGATWQWELREHAGGEATRLLVRQRLVHPRRRSALWHVVEPVNFVMERRMLLGIRARAERRPRPRPKLSHPAEMMTP
jgi:hypothetical protein